MIHVPVFVIRSFGVAAVLAMPVARAEAIVRTWAAGGTSSPYLAPSSWSPAGVPVNEDATLFAFGGAPVFTDLSGAAFHRLLIVRVGEVSFDLGGHDLSLTWDADSGILIGETPGVTADLSLTNGTVTCNRVQIAVTASVQAGLALTGSTSLTTLELAAGQLSPAEVMIAGGADLAVLGSTVLGQAALGAADLTVDGLGSTLSAGPVTCALLGTADMCITDGGLVIVGSLVVGDQVGSNGTVSVLNGSQLEATSLDIGVIGDGEMSITTDSALEVAGALGLGAEPSGAGTLLVQGGSTCFVGGFMVVGGDGGGTLEVDSASIEIDGVSDIAFAAGSTGTVSLTNATWSNAGQIRVGLGGAGTLSLTNSTVDPASVVTVYADSTLSGDGMIDGGLTNVDGTVCPGGAAAGAIAVSGSFVQQGGCLEMGVGTSSDQLTTGFAFLGGKLVVSLLGGFVPVGGEQFVLIDATGISGFFDDVDLPTLPAGLDWLLEAMGNDIVLAVVAICGADVNGDGTVDVSDLVEVIVAWGPCPGGCPADIDQDGMVSVQDLVSVILDWGPC